MVRSRNLGRVTVVAPRRRLQSRSVLQSPFQRRVRLATFETTVASGIGGSALEVTDLGFDDAGSLAEALSARRSGPADRDAPPDRARNAPG